MVTISLGKEASIREITVEVRDEDQADEVRSKLVAIEGVRVLWHRDRALIRHEGGKLTIEPTRPVA